MGAHRAVSAPDGIAGVGQPDILAGTPAWLRLWLAPIGEPLRRVGATADKPLAELTMTDLVAWGCVLTYAAATGMVAARLAANLAAAAVRGPGPCRGR